MKDYKIHPTHRRLLIMLMVPIFALLPFGSCEIQEDFEYKYSNPGGKLSINAWEFIQQTESLSLMEEAIVAAGMQDYYSGSTEYTFIVPSDDAFSSYLKANKYASLSAIPVPILKNLLLYHIVKAKVLFSDPAINRSNDPITYKTVNGQPMYLSRSNNYQGIINQGSNKSWVITTSNLEPTNGVIHISPAIAYFSAVTGDTNLPDPKVETDTIYAVHDTYVNGGSKADINFGADPLIKVKNISAEGNSYFRKAYLMFNLGDFDKEGIVTDIKFKIAVSFTAAKGVNMNLFSVPDNTWTEMGMTWNNAPAAEASPIVSITTTKVAAFNFNITDYYNGLTEKGLVSFMLEGEKDSDETDDLASKEHPNLPKPMLIATLASGAGNLVLINNKGFSVESGGIFVLSSSVLEIAGAPSADIIYKIEQIPSNGWLIKGASVLKIGDKVTQMDIEAMNLVYISNGNGTSDQLVLSARDKTGSSISPFNVNITIQ